MRETDESNTANLGDFQLGPFQVLPTQSLLRQPANNDTPEREVHVEPKVMAVLERLAQEPLEVVSRNALLNDVWTGTVVTDEVVTRCISELRQALGDSSRSPDYIQTIPKKGYKLLKVPSPLDVGQSSTADSHEPAEPVSRPYVKPRLYWALAASIAVASVLGLMLLQEYGESPEGAELADRTHRSNATTQTNSDSSGGVEPNASEPAIAILPFTTLNSDEDGAETDYFGAGLAEELLNALVNVPGLRVVSRHAAADASAASLDTGVIADALGADAVLTGSVRRINDSVRVSAQLINGTDGVHMWADQFEGKLGDVFSIQDEIAAAIVGALRLQLTEPVRVARISTDMNALDYYLLGRHQWHQRTAESLTRAIELFKRAVQEDADMAIAYSGLADAYLLLADYGDMPNEEAQALARPAIDRALALEPELAEAHASRGMLHLSLGEAQLAERALRNALRFNPSYHMAHMWLGSAIASQGQVKDAHKFYLQAYRLDPLHPVINQNVAMSFATIGDYTASKEILARFDPRFDNRHQFGALKLYMAQQTGDFAQLQELATADMTSDDVQRRIAAYHALWLMHSRRGQDATAQQYLTMAQAEPEVSYAFLLDVARKFARAGEASKFTELMRSAPTPFHEKVAREKLALEGLLLIATENYTKAASVLETAVTTASKKRHPAQALLEISHLLHAYQQLENTERHTYWLERGNKIISDAMDAGYGQFEFITEVAFFHAAAGNSAGAAHAFWQALTLGKLAPWEITDDIRVSRIQKSRELQPVVQQAARNWTA